MKQLLVRAARGAALFSLLLLSAAVVLPPAAFAQDGGAPPPADSSDDDAPAAGEPRSLQPPPPDAPTPAPIRAPGVRSAPVFTWGDSTGLVLPPLADVRAGDELAADIEASRMLLAGAENRMLKARERSVRWKSQVEIQKSREETLKRQIDSAKKEKREGDKKDLEAQKEREQRVRDYYESMRETMETAADFHKATLDYARARISAAELEQRLGERWGSGGYVARVSGEVRDLERRVLAAAKDRADQMSNFASKEKSLVDKRLQALKLWGELQK